MSAGISHLRFGVAADNAGAILTGHIGTVSHDIHDAISALPFVIVGTEGDHADICDVIAETDTDIGEINASIEVAPLACITLATLLRGAESRSIEESLVAESSAYSLLQSGPEFARWRELNPPKPMLDEVGPVVLVESSGDTTLISFNRPLKHNAFNSQMQSELVEALSSEIANGEGRVVISGNGKSFCSGGDLDEFGSRPDSATSHVVRLTRSAGRLLRQLGDRVEFQIHGACMGAGIELPAFAPSVTAKHDTKIALPEIRLGLIPGAGGTASMPRRIGRHRTALLALTARTIDAELALAWGLVDKVV